MISAATIVGVLIVLPLVFNNAYLISVLFFGFILVALAVAWNIPGGLAYILVLGSNAFFGLGAYSMAYLWIHGFNPFLGIIAGGLSAGFLALAMSPFFKRLRGLYFALATIIVASAIEELFLNWNVLLALVGGSAGLILPQRQYGSVVFYYYALILALVAFIISYWIMHSRLRLTLGAIRADQEAAASIGINVFRYQVIALVMSAILFGFAGAVYAYSSVYIDPVDIFDITMWGVGPVFMCVLGGVGTLYGPIIGASALIFLNAYFSSAGQYRELAYALGILVILVVHREGLLSLFEKLWRIIGLIRNRQPFEKRTQSLHSRTV